MKHQVLQVLTLVVLTKADRDGHGASPSSAVYPHTFFGVSSESRHEERQNKFDTFNRARSGKSLDLSEVEDNQSPLAESVNIDLPRNAKASSLDNAFQQVASINEGSFDNRQQIDNEPEKSNLDETSVEGRRGKAETFPQESRGRIIHRPLNQEAQIRDLNRFHKDVQRKVISQSSGDLPLPVLDDKPTVHVIESGPTQQSVVRVQPRIEEPTPEAIPLVTGSLRNRGNTFEFRDSKNQVKTLKEIHAEIDQLKKSQKFIALNDAPRLQPEEIPESQIVVADPSVDRVTVVKMVLVPVEPEVSPAPTVQRIIPQAPIRQRLNNQQSIQASLTHSGFKPVETTFVHHQVQKKIPSNQRFIQSPETVIRNEIPDVVGLKPGRDSRVGKAEPILESPIAHQTSPLGVSPIRNQRLEVNTAGFRGLGSHKTGNFVSSTHIGKTSSLGPATGVGLGTPVISQNKLQRPGGFNTNRVSAPFTFFGGQSTPSKIRTIQEPVLVSKTDAFNNAGQVAPNNAFFGGLSQGGRASGNFFTSSQFGHTSSIGNAQSQLHGFREPRLPVVKETVVSAVVEQGPILHKDAPIDVEGLSNIRPEVRGAIFQSKEIVDPQLSGGFPQREVIPTNVGGLVRF